MIGVISHVGELAELEGDEEELLVKPGRAMEIIIPPLENEPRQAGAMRLREIIDLPGEIFGKRPPIGEIPSAGWF